MSDKKDKLAKERYSAYATLLYNLDIAIEILTPDGEILVTGTGMDELVAVYPPQDGVDVLPPGTFGDWIIQYDRLYVVDKKEIKEFVE